MHKPGSVVIGPDEGLSLWQPMPSRGYVNVNLMPDNMPYDTFSSGIQVLPPGCSVREHGHRQNHELIFVYKGQGRADIDGESYDLVEGSTVLFSRNSVHYLENTGEEDMHMFWVFFPPGLEDWFQAIGKPRKPGQDMPEPFERPQNVQDVMNGLKFMPPKT